MGDSPLWEDEPEGVPVSPVAEDSASASASPVQENEVSAEGSPIQEEETPAAPAPQLASANEGSAEGSPIQENNTPSQAASESPVQENDDDGDYNYIEENKTPPNLCNLPQLPLLHNLPLHH